MTDPRPSIFAEATAPAEYAALLADPVYWGAGVARGDGRPVVVLPGLFGGDFYLAPIRAWLARVGYRPVRSALAFNVGCPERLSRLVEEQLRRDAPGMPFSIVGHSRGGILGWAIASRLGSRVRDLVLVGSPAAPLADAIRAGGLASQPNLSRVSSAVRRASERSRAVLDPDCDFPLCGCPFVGAMSMPLDAATRLVTITSVDDAIVPADAARAPRGAHHTVRGSHSGLLTNGSVYRLIGAALAETREGPGRA